ncbi:MAG: nucleotidyltransferase family protein [Firmicutes bacterium]|nr:nucleotidyltransferase family protein [Bacillota bacterium]
MKIGGIIAEYNPFHNGHKYQIERVKEECDGVIAVMSGGFVQRGDAACADKLVRARAAVLNGCDLVLELPVCCALNTAQIFALGGVTLLDKLGVTDNLYFGSECGNIQRLKDAAQILDSETDEISARIKSLLSEGNSFARARHEAYGEIIGGDILSQPNNILAVEYIRALKRIGSGIIPVSITRRGAAHDSGADCGGAHDGAAASGIASASYIRELIRGGADYSKYVPKSAYALYSKSDMSYDISNIDSLILGTLRLADAKSLVRINDMGEGLENRIISAAKSAVSFEDLCRRVKSKRYTMSRVRRVILSAVLGIDRVYDISYIRVLAANDNGRRILREIKEKSELPIITKAALYKGGSPSFALDVKVRDIHALCSSEMMNRAGGKDFTSSPAIL